MNEKQAQAVDVPQEVSTETATVAEQVSAVESSAALTGAPESAGEPAE